MRGHTVMYLCKSGSKNGSFCIVDTQTKIVLHLFLGRERHTQAFSRKLQEELQAV